MKRNPWVVEIIEEELGKELSRSITPVVASKLCVACKGVRMLCGKARCPILLRLLSQLKLKSVFSKREMQGSTPPEVFVGSLSYPKVTLAPSIPPCHGDTSIFAFPERWMGKSMEEIVEMRTSLVRGSVKVHVKKDVDSKLVDMVREIAMSKSSVEIFAEFSKPPRGKILLCSHAQPYGPSAPLRNFSPESFKLEKTLERVYYDTDLSASEAVFLLYQKGLPVSRIQRVFSLGALGRKKSRRLVPTRWSITAVDSIISQGLREEVKTFEELDEIRVYAYEFLDNKWYVIMLPGSWSYELIEAWMPKTLWNPSATKAVVYSSFERFEGRKDYAEIGGCYYAARLAVCEKLIEEKKQAIVVILREINPGYIMPVGVWNVREAVREALKRKPMIFGKDYKRLVNFLLEKLKLRENVLRRSILLKERSVQKRLLNF